jgi:hypothetical protein
MVVALCERYSAEVAALKELPVVANSFEASRLHRLKDMVYDQSDRRSSEQPIKLFSQCQTSNREFYVAQHPLASRAIIRGEHEITVSEWLPCGLRHSTPGCIPRENCRKNSPAVPLFPIWPPTHELVFLRSPKLFFFSSPPQHN